MALGARSHFTPSRELPMAGRPTIGTIFALAGAGRLRTGADKVVLGLGIGPTPVGLEWDRNALRLAWIAQPIPTFGPIVTVAADGLVTTVAPGEADVDVLVPRVVNDLSVHVTVD